MQHRTTDPANGGPRETTDSRSRGNPWRVNLVKVRSGVAAGNTKRGLGNVRTEWWALFMTREQFHACCADDPLRFTDPLLFAQMTTEFDHVFDRPS